MWLDDVLATFTLTDDVRGYLLGRGVSETTITSEGIVTWQPTEMEIPDAEFRKRYGPHGGRLEGFLTCPVYAPTGNLIGFEVRSIQAKLIQDYRLPSAKWNPFFLGLRGGLPKVWAGGDVWIVEGIFDKSALEWAVPAKDAVLATVRAGLSANHVEFLRRFLARKDGEYTAWVHMCYDNDDTGQRAMNGWIDTNSGKRMHGAKDRLEKAGLKCRVVKYAGGKDPGEIWDRGGKQAVKAAFNV